MVKITAVYAGDLHTTATHGPSGATLETDAPVDNQGRGESFSPTDLVATALGTCVLTTMGILAKRLGVDLKGARVEVGKEMTATAPRKIARLAVDLWMPIAKAEDPQGQLERAAHACPVHRSLHPEVDAPITIHWKE